jgi:hypothetical protein
VEIVSIWCIIVSIIVIHVTYDIQTPTCDAKEGIERLYGIYGIDGIYGIYGVYGIYDI